MSTKVIEILDHLRGTAKGVEETLRTWDQKVQLHVPTVTGEQPKGTQSDYLPEIECIKVCKRIHALELTDEATEETSQPRLIYNNQPPRLPNQVQVRIFNYSI